MVATEGAIFSSLVCLAEGATGAAFSALECSEETTPTKLVDVPETNTGGVVFSDLPHSLQKELSLGFLVPQLEQVRDAEAGVPVC